MRRKKVRYLLFKMKYLNINIFQLTHILQIFGISKNRSNLYYNTGNPYVCMYVFVFVCLFVRELLRGPWADLLHILGKCPAWSRITPDLISMKIGSVLFF